MVVSQGFLAGAVAKALGTFCELDESLVESRLLNKSRITLKDLRLRPKVLRQTMNYNVELHGKIKSGVFKWKWSGKGLLKRCTFTLTGLRITLKPVSGNSKHAIQFKEKKDQSVPSTEDSEAKRGKKRWKDNIVKNILEQLVVKIEDVQVVLEAPRNAKEDDMPWKRQVIIYGRDLELEPLGRLYQNKFLKGRALRRNKHKAPLIQDLRIGSLSAKVVVIGQDGAATMLPLIHPFRYSAKWKRMHGKRFGSFSTGLEVVGQEITSLDSISHPSFTKSASLGAYESIKTGNDRVEIYADEREVEASLCNFPSINYSQSVSWEFTPTSSLQESRDEMEVQNSQEPEVADEVYIVLGDEQLKSLFSVITLFTDKKGMDQDLTETRPLSRGSYLKKHYMRPGGLAQLTKVAPMSFAKSSRSIVKSSHFLLPFPMVQVDLPNNTSLYAEECNIQFRADDSIAKIYGTGEVTVDNEILLQQGVTWTVDLRRKEIKIEPPTESSQSQWEWNFMSIEEQGIGSQLLVNFDRIRKLAAGIVQVMKKRKELQARRSPPGLSQNLSNQSNSNRGRRWSVKLCGNSCLQF